jgi:hypothetical protein
MAVGVVTDDAFAKPDHPAHAKRVFEVLLDLLPAHMRVAIAVEQTLLAGETNARAVDFNRTAFENDRVIEHPDLQQLGDGARHALVLLIGMVLPLQPLKINR